MSDQMRRTIQDLVESIIIEYTHQQPEVEPEPAGGSGMFPDIDRAVSAGVIAQKQLMEMSLEGRKKVVEAMRKAAEAHAEAFSRTAVEETGIGCLEDKITKNLLAARMTPGVEDLEPSAYTGDHGLSLVERAPYGVIGAIIPVTNPTATVINNSISMIAAGNSVVFNPHPSARETSALAVSVLHDAAVSAGGPKHLLTAAAQPTIETANILMNHRDISILVVTGGPGVVKAAMGSGKKVIAAGPGNPPCVVDETAHLPRAARDIISGAGFDNNLVCICEKEVLVVESVAEELLKQMSACGGYLLDAQQTKQITELVIEKPGSRGVEGVINKQFVGKSASYIANQIGLQVPKSVKVLLCDVDESHPLVWTEQLMPVLPVVRMADVDRCIDLAVACEHGFRHTAMMHSLNVEKLSQMAKRMNCSLFVKNGPCYAGLGQGGAGFTSFTIASPTGEGLTRARTFTRERRCTLVDSFRIV